MRVTGRTCACLTANVPSGNSGAAAVEELLAPAQEVEGYEIHHGRTVPLLGQAGNFSLSRESAVTQPRVIMADSSGRPLGWGLCNSAGRARVWGSYVHGLFDADAFRHAFLASLRADSGMPPLEGAPYALGPELDRLADTVEKSLDMPTIYGLLGLC